MADINDFGFELVEDPPNSLNLFLLEQIHFMLNRVIILHLIVESIILHLIVE